MKQLVVISGKGGTGKTSILASFAQLAASSNPLAIADCDVEAPDLGNQLAGVVLGYAESGVDQGPKGGSALHPHAGLVVDEGYDLHGTDQGTDTTSLAGERIHDREILDPDRSRATLLGTQSTERAAVGVDPRAATRPEPLGSDLRAR